MTSDVNSAGPGFAIVYGTTIDYYNAERAPRWYSGFPYTETTVTYNGNDVHYNCRRDRSYTMPLCCEITVNKSL